MAGENGDVDSDMAIDGVDEMTGDGVDGNVGGEGTNGSNANNVLSSPPGSSPGMMMRSGRKKKRGASSISSSSAASTPVKPRTAGSPESSAPVAATPTPRKPSKRTKISTASEPLTPATLKAASKSPTNAAATSASEVHSRQTRKAVQVGETIQENGDAEEAEEVRTDERSGMALTQDNHEEKNGNGHKKASGATLAAQKLRLPSQHTPAKPGANVPTNTSGSSRLPGRRLVLEGDKRTSNSTSTSTENRGIRPHQLQQRHQKIQQKQSERQQEERQDRLIMPRNDQRVQSREEDQYQSHPTTEPTRGNAILSYTIGWCIVLVASIIALTIAKSPGVDGSSEKEGFLFPLSFVSKVFDVRLQSSKLNEFYGLGESAPNGNDDSNFTLGEIAQKNEHNDSKESDAEKTNDTDVDVSEPLEIVEVIEEVVDPSLLQHLKAKLRARRMNENRVQKFDASITELQQEVELLDKVINDYKTSIPYLESLLEAANENGEPPSQSFENKSQMVNQVIQSMYSNLEEKGGPLRKWESALREAEEATENYFIEENIDVGLVNELLSSLSEVSMVPSSGTLFSKSMVSVPGEGCEGDYVFPDLGDDEDTEEDEEEEEEGTLGEEEVEVVGAINVDALDYASDAPVRIEDAQMVYKSLLVHAQSTCDALVGPSGPSAVAQLWVKQIVDNEFEKKGVHGDPPFIEELRVPDVAKKAKQTIDTTDTYTAQNAVIDIYRLLEIEDADRTGKFDFASVSNGAEVLRRGPYATSYSLYETLPLFNRVLAITKLRFYGHPPEVAVLPSGAMHSRGRCWSFQNEMEKPSLKRRGIANDGIRGEYATLSVSLAYPATVTEVVLDHLPPSVSTNPKTAVRDFRVLGFDDSGAFGEPWELGSFEYRLNDPSSLQVFKIPTSIDGFSIPKLKAVSLAVDSNWGADYACLYRFKVHGV